MKTRFGRHVPLVIGLFLCALVSPLPGVEPPAAAAAAPVVIKYSKSLPVDALAGKADSDLVELSNGKRLRMGDIRRLTSLGQQLRAAAPGSRAPAALRTVPAASGVPMRNATDIAAAIKRPDTETLQLPSGKTLTVGQLKLVRAEVERRLGHSLATLPQRPDLSGPPIRIGSNADWKSLLKKPDSTVLEAPDGTRITVGELKQTLAETSTKPAGLMRKR